MAGYPRFVENRTEFSGFIMIPISNGETPPVCACEHSRKKTMRFPITALHRQDSGYELRVGDHYYACDDLFPEDVTAIAGAFGGTVTARTKDEAVSLMRGWMLRQLEREEVGWPVPQGSDATVDWKQEGS